MAGGQISIGPLAEQLRAKAALAKERYSDPDWYAKEMGTFTAPGAAGGAPVPAPGIPTAAPGAPAAAGAAGAAETDPMAMYRQALERLSGGGAMLESSLADIETGKREAIGAGQQTLVSAGLGGTTMMAGVPVTAERGAGRARLAARGQVEQLRLQTLASYAGLAEQAKQAGAERRAALKRLQTQIGAQKAGATAAQKAETERLQTQIAATREPLAPATERGGFITGMGEGTAFAPSRWDVGGGFDYSGFTNIVSGGAGGGYEPYSYGAHLTPDIPRTMVSGVGPTTAYAQQFPSIYGQAEEPVPQWM